MDNPKIPHQAIQGELKCYKRKLEWPRKNWMVITRKGLKDTGTIWEKAKKLTFP